ncbi:hypothetical protein LC653_31030 [Nostoc sp. CHAB 5784]|uniref:hypothetical protein n=1 Tax=Nostoc mirabile TaxID=2907820 RepID=UPI001E41BB53|nr:hypothetical protein [Nostoc mirabile]MCC5668177.1 hypothetical protein [Nostoc mirabile CHAB5784]
MKTPALYQLQVGMTVKASLAATKLAPNNKLYGVTSMVNKTNPTQSNNILARLLAKVDVKIIIPTGVVVAILGYLPYGFQAAFHSQQLEPSAQVQLRPFGRAEYEQLRIGMSLTDVRSILNRGVEVSRSATMASFVWENPDGSKITATFENDKLKSKKQSGLN